jgi:hypothetical protein
VEEIRRMVEEGMRGRDEGSGFGVQGRGGGAGNRGEDAGLVAPGLPEKRPIPGKRCPKCGVAMVKREGARGALLGCPNYPTCRQTMAA